MQAQSEVKVAISEPDVKVAVAVAEPVVVTPQQPAPLETKVRLVAAVSARCLLFVCYIRRLPPVQHGQSCSAFCQSARGLASNCSKVRPLAVLCVRAFVCV